MQMHESFTHPLKGTRVINFRSPEQSKELCKAVIALGGEPVSFPLIKINPFNKTLACITSDYLCFHQNLIFTSVNAVRFFIEASLNNRCFEQIYEKKIFSIGEQTTQYLAHYGLKVALTAKTASSEGLLKEMDRDLEGQSFLIPSAYLGRELLPNTLRSRGADVTVLKIYETASLSAERLYLQPKDCLVMTSPSIVESFFLTISKPLPFVHFFCIGEFSCQAVQRYYKGEITIAEEASVKSIVQSILNFVSSQ